jgi:hypothetical protein
LVRYASSYALSSAATSSLTIFIIASIGDIARHEEAGMRARLSF